MAELTTEVEYNGEEVTVEVTFNPGWFKAGNRRGHPDNWEPDEGEAAEVLKIELEGEGDITLKIGKEQLERVQVVCDKYVPDYPEPSDDYDYDDRSDDAYDSWRDGQDAWERSQGI